MHEIKHSSIFVKFSNFAIIDLLFFRDKAATLWSLYLYEITDTIFNLLSFHFLYLKNNLLVQNTKKLILMKNLEKINFLKIFKFFLI